MEQKQLIEKIKDTTFSLQISIDKNSNGVDFIIKQPRLIKTIQCKYNSIDEGLEDVVKLIDDKGFKVKK